MYIFVLGFIAFEKTLRLSDKMSSADPRFAFNSLLKFILIYCYCVALYRYSAQSQYSATIIAWYYVAPYWDPHCIIQQCTVDTTKVLIN